jgi:hypothetical protein
MRAQLPSKHVPVLKTAQNTPNLLCGPSQADWPGLLEELQSCSAQLEVVERGLNDFLDTKKMAFPRCGGCDAAFVVKRGSDACFGAASLCEPGAIG